MIRRLIMAALATVLMGLGVDGSADSVPVRVASDSALVDTAQAAPEDSLRDSVIAYYFHGHARCATCRKLEAYSQEALLDGFPEEITDSTVVLRSVNYDEKENKHFLEHYKLYTKALILSRTRDGQEIAWKNLDKIWKLVGDKDKFIEYVQSETRAFLNAQSTE